MLNFSPLNSIRFLKSFNDNVGLIIHWFLRESKMPYGEAIYSCEIVGHQQADSYFYHLAYAQKRGKKMMILIEW